MGSTVDSTTFVSQAISLVSDLKVVITQGWESMTQASGDQYKRIISHNAHGWYT